MASTILNIDNKPTYKINVLFNKTQYLGVQQVLLVLLLLVVLFLPVDLADQVFLFLQAVRVDLFDLGIQQVLLDQALHFVLLNIKV